MINIKPALLFAFAVLSPLLTVCQMTLSGKVFSSLTHEPLAGATISLFAGQLPSPSARTFSDSAGRFAIDRLNAGQYRLEITASGYQPLNQNVVLQQDLSDSFFITPLTQLLREVVINAARPAFQRKGERLVLPVSGNPFFKTSMNAADVLRKVPGLSVGGDGTILFEGRIAPAVFIDGKPVPMSTEELQAYLGNLNAEMIASVDLIANPSARYDGEYKAIIDIRLKKDLNLGLKGNISSTVTRNDYTLAEHNLLLTYKKPKLVYILRGGYTSGTRDYRYRARQILSDKNILNTRTHTPSGQNNLSYQFGAEYSIGQQHRIELLLRQSMVNRDVHSLNRLLATSPEGSQTILNTYTRNTFAPKQDNYGANLNYTANLSKTTLQFVGSLLKITNRQQEDIQNRQTVDNSLLSYWQTALKNDITIRTAQADLFREAVNGKINIGLKYASSSTSNDLKYDTLSTSGNFVPDAGRSNNFAYDEYISAGYLGYDGNRKDLSYSISLRAEHTRSTANSITTGIATERSYLNWLPSFSLTYTKNNHQYHLSFTRKMTRPNFLQLNPFRFYLSPLNYHVGNPLLLPSKTSSFNLSYSYKTLSIRLSAGKETDPLARYPEYDDSTHTLEYLGRNLPYNHFANTELVYSFAITRWWKLNHTLSLLYKKELTPYHDKLFSIGIWECTMTGSQVFTLPGSFNIDVSYKYLSPGGNGLYYTRPYFYIDFGIQKSWLGGRLNTRLNYYDIFNGFEVQYIFREKQIINNELAHWFGTSRVTVSVSFSFGRSTFKTRQATRGEEEARIGL